MIPRGSYVRATIAVLILAGVSGRVAAANAAPPKITSDNARTITVSLPGPFNGCTYLDAGASPTSNAVLDLIRPSAFLTNTNGNLVGEGGPIATAELISLQPETVVYTMAPALTWSNGLAFNGRDLQAWWHRAAGLASIQSDGYRAIKSLTISKNALSVTAVFKSPYADWNLLFRDVEARGVAPGCTITNLVSRPSLGPYKVVSATTSRVVLVLDPHWTSDLGRFGRIVLTTAGVLPTNDALPFANYSLTVNRAQEQALSAHPTVLSHIGTSSTIAEITFAPVRPLTRALAIREALSLSLNRQSLINQLWGSVTFSPSIAASALFSQGQSAYPGLNGSGPATQSTTTTTVVSGIQSGLDDCLACAFLELRNAGYHHLPGGWFNANGGLLSVKLAVGPTGLDEATAALVVKQWASAGLSSSVISESSDLAAASAASSGLVDAAVFSRPTLTAASFTARSWSGPAYPDSYSSGVRSATMTTLYSQAIQNFNPVTANATWLQLDQTIMTAFWVRPLFTAPSLVAWSSTVSGVLGSLSVPGFVDQIVNWNTTPPAQN